MQLLLIQLPNVELRRDGLKALGKVAGEHHPLLSMFEDSHMVLFDLKVAFTIGVSSISFE